MPYIEVVDCVVVVVAGGVTSRRAVANHDQLQMSSSATSARVALTRSGEASMLRNGEERIEWP